jgi:HK97 family phage portal protein
VTGFSGLKSDGESWTRESSPAAESRAIVGEELWWSPSMHAGVAVTPNTALRNPAYLSTLNVLATDVAVLPIDVIRERPDGARTPATEHAVYPLLRRSPDGIRTPMRWKQALMGHALQHEGGYAEIQRTGRGAPYGLHLLCPETTRPVQDPSGAVRYEIEGGRRYVPAANVLHVAGFGYDGLRGYSFTRLLGQALGLSIAAETSAANYFANGSEPGGVIESPKRLSDDAAERFLSNWETRHGGPGRRHRTAVLEEGMTWKQTSTDPEKAQLLDTRKFQVIDASRPWRVPAHKLGDFSQAHLSNIESSNLDYLMTALMGWLTAIEEEFSLKLFSPKEWAQGYRVVHDTHALLRGNVLARYQAYEIALRNGWMNRDQIRRRENLNPMAPGDGGEVYTVQAQMIPLSDVGRAPAPAPAPPTGSEVPPDGQA